MLLSGLVLSRWCEYYLMQWSLSRKMTSNRARYLNQELIVLVRCRKPVIFRVGICVGIRWYCLLLTILNHEVKSHVRVRPSHHTVCKSSRSRAAFLCLKSPISVQYIGLPEKQFSILHFVVDGPKFALAGSCIVHITWAGWFRYATWTFWPCGSGS